MGWFQDIKQDPSATAKPPKEGVDPYLALESVSLRLLPAIGWLQGVPYHAAFLKTRLGAAARTLLVPGEYQFSTPKDEASAHRLISTLGADSWAFIVFGGPATYRAFVVRGGLGRGGELAVSIKGGFVGPLPVPSGGGLFTVSTPGVVGLPGQSSPGGRLIEIEGNIDWLAKLPRGTFEVGQS